jgi:hypothetical protein
VLEHSGRDVDADHMLRRIVLSRQLTQYLAGAGAHVQAAVAALCASMLTASDTARRSSHSCWS